jgi:acyl transferase domain-containing protein/thioesterase domain-containing protein/SAM-dependent methyltransferase/acyl carrier protein
MACRFPGASCPDSFWRLLAEGRDAITEVPADRWNVDEFYVPETGTPGKMNTRWGGFIDKIDRFDAEFFHISPREAALMDPQQRLLMEVAWEALEAAGVPPRSLAGTQTGSFVGISSGDYATQLVGHGGQTSAYAGTGVSHAIAANRLAYHLDLQGPSMAVDTACSSSLVAVHLACQSLRARECDLALAAGANAILTPELTIVFSQAGMMSPTGRCRTFDADADGYVRSEGCGVLVLKRLADAMADRDPIAVVVLGSAVNQDGRSNGLTAPNGRSQQRVIRQALGNAGIKSSDLQYIEAHGTGTPLGDPIELEAIKAVLLPERLPDQTCYVGSVKANIGHLEAAAGIAGLIRTALALQRGKVPPQVHFKTLNPQVSLAQTPLHVATHLEDWPRTDRPRRAGVSSFGFGGTNAHVILEQAPLRTRTVAGLERPAHVLALSARTEKGLNALARQYADYLEGDGAERPVADICFTSTSGRSHFNHRLAIPLTSRPERSRLAESMRTWAETGLAKDRMIHKIVQSPARPRLVFLFTGQGAQYAGMARQLYETEPVFQEALERCAGLLEPHLDHPLLSIIFPDDGGDARIDHTAFGQPALFSLEYALCEMWRAWGISPDAVLGHSLGEYAAACVAGAFSLEEGLRLVAERARLMGALPMRGKMAAVFAGVDDVKLTIAPFGSKLSIAAINTPALTVISGETTTVEAAVDTFESAGVRCQLLTVSHAFHSALIEPILDDLEKAGKRISFSPLTIPLAANLTGELLPPGTVLDASYFRGHARETVQFLAGLRVAAAEAGTFFLEIGPAPVLIDMGKRCVAGGSCFWAPSLRPGRPDWHVVTDCLSQLYVHGLDPDWKAYERGYNRHKVSLPTYPFDGARHWCGAVRTELRVDVTGAVTAAGVQPAPSNSILPAQHGLQWKPMSRLAHRANRSSSVYMPRVSVLAAHARALVEQRVGESGLEAYTSVEVRLDAIGARFILEAFERMGWVLQPGSHVDAEDLAARLRIAPAHRRLFKRLLEILAEEGVLLRQGSNYVVHRVSTAITSGTLKADALKRYPESEAELTLLERCGLQLDAVLRGDVDPLRVLFPDGSFDGVERVYEESPVSRLFNHLVRGIFARIVSDLPVGRVLRVLEIGAGTGSTTASAIQDLPPDATEYVFSDVSNQFLPRAEEKFGAFPFIRYAMLDIEKKPSGQGFAPRQFDVVLAANVLHATEDLRRSLAHVHELLAPGGLLLLLEVTKRLQWLDITFGLTEGWWKFRDLYLRPDHPQLPANRWIELLEGAGFTDATAIPDSEVAGVSPFSQSLLLARAVHTNALGQRDEARAVGNSSWLVVTDGGGIAEALCAQLRDSEDQCRVVGVGQSFALNGSQARIRPYEAGDWVRALSGLGQRLLGPPERIVYFAPLNASSTDSSFTATFQERKSVMVLIQALEALEFAVSPRLWIVTRDGRESEEYTDLFGEHPQFKGGIINVSGPTSALPVEELLEIMLNPEGQDRFLLRDTVRYVPGRDRGARDPGSSRAETLPRTSLAGPIDTEGPTNVASYLKQQFGRVLFRDPFSIPDDKDFTDMGLDSLMAMELIRGIERDFGINIDPRDIVSRPTVRALAEYLSDRIGHAPHTFTEVGVRPARATESKKGAGSKLPTTVFLISSPYAGSASLLTMLSRQRRVLCLPRLDLLLLDTMAERRGQQERTRKVEDAQPENVGPDGLDAKAIYSIIDEMARFNAPVREVYARLQEVANGRLLIDESPLYAADLETIERIEHLFDAAKYIHFVCHPYSMIESYVRAYSSGEIAAEGADPIATAEQIWALSHCNMQRFARRIDPERVHIVRYEDFVADSDRVLRRLLEFLGLPFEANLFVSSNDSDVPGNAISDPNESSALLLNTQAVDGHLPNEAWRDIDLERPLSGFVRRIAAELNYELPKEGIKPKLSHGSFSSFVPMQPLGAKPPLFFVAPAGGVVFPYYKLLDLLDRDQPVYGLQDPGLQPDSRPFETVAELARYHIKAIKTVQPDGPYLLAGWSFGGTVAYEMAQQLTREEYAVPLVFLIDTFANDAGPRRRSGILLKNIVRIFFNFGVGLGMVRFTLPYIRDGLFLVTLQAREREGTNQDRPSLREYVRWVWADSLRQYLLREAGVAEIAQVVSKHSRLQMIRQPTVRRTLRVLHANVRALRNYVPLPYNGRLSLVRANKPTFKGKLAEAHTLGWSHLVQDRVDVYTIGGNHVTVFSEPYIGDLAAHLSECLQKAYGELLGKRQLRSEAGGNGGREVKYSW